MKRIVLITVKFSVGLYQDETIVSNHPWATKDELEKIKRQKEEDYENSYPNFPLKNHRR